ncbi:SMI1/KNR4 family protein [Psychromonas algicola]|uniref:SMI1/KNR4 family protein n=1 Tax=Psychromonas algicola TaxID=2555642 RepID=UPI0010678D6D|nr:SMI1/KNR4 family protein [Psychromonas sp. RZ5]TEW45075.1 SMI1/KNR4 family protein [Psychromonas sp. RZ5]
MNFTHIEEYFLNKLPKAYREFMLEVGGGHFGDVFLYGVEDLIERNECYETKEYAPGWIAIGDDGGGRAIIISFSDDDPQVFIVDHGVMEPDEAEQVFDCFTSWKASYFSL